MNQLVKITRDDDGDLVDDPKWHAIVNWDGSDRTLCSAEAFGYGEGSAEYQTKTTKRGGVTCNKCVVMLREIKSFKL